MALLMLPWWPLSPWLSPAAAWFIFFNAVVGAIAVMSSSAQQAGQGGGGATSSSRRRLCRSGSSSTVLDRLRSFSIFSVHPTASGITGPPLDDGSAASDSHCHYCFSQRAGNATATQVMRSSLAVDATAAGEAATSGSPPPSPTVATAKAEQQASLAPAPAPAPEPAGEEDKPEAEEVLQDESIGLDLDEAYALAQRHRAAQPLASPPPAAAPATAAPTPTSPARRKNKKKPAKVADGIRRRAQGCGGPQAGEALEGKVELNERAELFIRQFREDLKLQRLNSILRHTQALGSPTAAR